MNMAQYGRIEIHLADLLEKSGLSKNKLCHRAEMQRTQINGYCNNTISRLDIDVLARLCYALNCEINDLLEYIPPDQKVYCCTISDNYLFGYSYHRMYGNYTL